MRRSCHTLFFTLGASQKFANRNLSIISTWMTRPASGWRWRFIGRPISSHFTVVSCYWTLSLGLAVQCNHFVSSIVAYTKKRVVHGLVSQRIWSSEESGSWSSVIVSLCTGAVANEIARPKLYTNSNNSSNECKNCQRKWNFQPEIE